MDSCQNEDKAIKSIDTYKRRMYRPTSKKDLEYMLSGKCKIILYSELDQYNAIDELLNPFGCCIILYPSPTDEDIGHWTCTFRVPGADDLDQELKYEYFDSYGCTIDDPIEKYNKTKTMLHKRGRIEPKLLKLMAEANHEGKYLNYNETPFQSNEFETSTCGLWCVMRLKENHLNEDHFRGEYYELPKGMDLEPDFFISAKICKLYPEMAVR